MFLYHVRRTAIQSSTILDMNMFRFSMYRIESRNIETIETYNRRISCSLIGSDRSIKNPLFDKCGKAAGR